MRAGLLILAAAFACRHPVPDAVGWETVTQLPSARAQAAVVLLTARAAAGDTRAQLELGHAALVGGIVMRRDRAAARGWLRLAVDQGPTRRAAAHLLGLAEHDADPAAAARWFEIAANEGSSEAMFLLANAYRSGTGIARDDARALALYETAAERDHAAALQTLALAYRFGELGLEPDEDAARRYEMEAEHVSHNGGGEASPPR